MMFDPILKVRRFVFCVSAEDVEVAWAAGMDMMIMLA